MTKAKQTDIKLAEAQAKFTKAKAAVDGTPKAEAAYQKAKKELALARQAYAVTRGTHTTGGDANVSVNSVAVKSGKGNTRR
jgi:hypothetical protein